MYTYSIKRAKIAKRLGKQVVVTVGSAGASMGATSVPVDALTGPLPNGITLSFGGSKVATLTAAAAKGATSLTVSALPVALVDDDEAVFGGYGPAAVINAVQMMTGNVRVRSAEGYGDDELKVIAGSKIGGGGQCRMLGVTLEALAIITGDEITDDPGVRVLAVDTGRLPHFGIVGMAEERPGVDTEDAGDGDELIFLPNCVATSDITLGTFEDGAFQTVEFSYGAVKSGDYKIINIIERETTGDFTIPPADIL